MVVSSGARGTALPAVVNTGISDESPNLIWKAKIQKVEWQSQPHGSLPAERQSTLLLTVTMADDDHVEIATFSLPEAVRSAVSFWSRAEGEGALVRG